jgi:hypothetical protein
MGTKKDKSSSPHLVRVGCYPNNFNLIGNKKMSSQIEETPCLSGIAGGWITVRDVKPVSITIINSSVHLYNRTGYSPL